ncbi:MAG: NAD-dependent epimerase/dehydratase family protein [Limimaricola soesokkakensis]|uniref:NAD-dependent epimerase/dehydratase family protein n=1 Tax=Limimaricola soesokkakensis TaxID=1343159 RepID=UPI0040587AFB
MTASPSQTGPLILGGTGRLGRALRKLALDGHWPEGRAALWHGRRGDYVWDMHKPAPPLPERPEGVVVLAGVTSGSPEELAANADLARAALRLAARDGLGPVLLMSSAAVYGRAEGPCREAEASPANAYGMAKLDMERVVAEVVDRLDTEAPRACCLRLANVAGCDQLFDAMAAGQVTLDRFAEGHGPRRAYVGPLSLARIVSKLLSTEDLPPVLNLAQPGAVPMEALLEAAGARWHWRPAPETALPETRLDTAQLAAIAGPIATATAPGLVAEARLAGWRLA